MIRRFPNLCEVNFSPDGKYLAGSTPSSHAGDLAQLDQQPVPSVRVCEVDSGKQIAVLERGRLCAFSPGGILSPSSLLMRTCKPG